MNACSSASAPRLCLHAASITFRHPVSHESLSFTSSIAFDPFESDLT